MASSYLTSAIKQFEYYKLLGEKTFEQLNDDQLSFQYNEESNSITSIVNHLHGNMMSRWTDFLTSDGEKEWRQREAEFAQSASNRAKMMDRWQQGWDCLFNALNEISDEQLEDIIYIRNQGHTIVEAINRQLAHYPYHIGQIVFIGKMLQNHEWTSLSIPRGTSANFNESHFSQPKSKKHFTDDYIK
jgi:Protein of unknown function (DUF1572)